jgi:hypothetical protein
MMTASAAVANARSGSQATILRNPNTWLILSLLVFFAVRIAFAYLMFDVDTSGDEGFQFSMAKNGFKVGKGGFLPGIGMYLWANQHIFGNFSLSTARLVLGLTNSVLFLIAVYLVKRTLGTWYATAFVVILTFFTEFHTFAFALWGDHAGSIFLIINVLYAYWMIDRVLHEAKIPLYSYAIIFLLFGASLYVRQNFLVFPIVILILTSIVFIFNYFRGGGWRPILFAIPLTYAFGLLWLIPWSIALTDYVGAFRFAPISQELSVPIHYGEEKMIEQTKKALGDDYNPDKNLFYAVHDAVRKVAREEHRPLLDVYKEFKTNALEGLTFDHALERIRDAWGNFLLLGGNFNQRFFNSDRFQSTTGEGLRELSKSVDKNLFIAAFALSLALAVIPFWGTLSQQTLVIAYKGVFCLVCLQPFVHRTNPRHHLFAVAFMVLGAVLLVRELRRVSVESSFGDMVAAEKVLFFAQALGGLVLVAAGLTIACYPV